MDGMDVTIVVGITRCLNNRRLKASKMNANKTNMKVFLIGLERGVFRL